tara:strand:+ start:183385 stop:183894 length:510 start_codon:yes stop_codon:yes gene_type:complete
LDEHQRVQKSEAMMSNSSENYLEKIRVAATPEQSFQAVARQMEKWWTVTTEGAFERVGDRVTVRFLPDYGYWIFEASVMNESNRLEMICVEAHHKVEGQPKEIDQEWLGTNIIWQFETVGDKTEITMTHDGLTPSLNCWGICLDGWNHFFKNSLKAFLDGGEPSPHAAG